MRPTIVAALLFTVLLSGEAAQGAPLDTCLRFKAPEQRAIVSAPACTLGVDTSCRRIIRTEIKVRYFPDNSDTAVVTTLPRIYRAPFEQVWDLKNIPNQLFIGIGLIIEVTFSNGQTSGLHREGIFLTHQPVRYPAPLPLEYEYPGTQAFPTDTVFIVSPSSVSAFAQMYWNEKAITARVSVRDTAFRSNVPQALLEQMGIVLLFDPGRKRRPYPTEDAMIFVVPLSGKPVQVIYKPEFGDSGGYNPNPVSRHANFESSVEKADAKGFSATLSIPRYLFGKRLPPVMGCNVIVKTSDAKGRIVQTSWVDAKGYNAYSPFLWAEMQVRSKHPLEARWAVWLVFFLAGLALPPLAYFAVATMPKGRPVVLHIKHSKENKVIFERMKEVVDLRITQAQLSGADIAAELKMSPKRLAAEVKKMTGLSLKNYLMFLRTEIVCERLRSSNASETAIAESCGFHDAAEMERYFRKFHHTTPYNYRKMQQVEQRQ